MSTLPGSSDDNSPVQWRVLENQETGSQEAGGLPLSMLTETYEKDTKTRAGKHGYRQSLEGRRIQSFEDGHHGGIAQRKEAEMVRPSHKRARR